ncbi:MAG: hypothetical protein J0653_02890, partial [Deltaproteobacteria bacterium]|nr:hypothetical protein [Deltaproteobacteria bacterium]
ALEAAKKADPGMEETTVLLNNIRDEFNPVPRKGKISKKSKKSKSKSKKSSKAKTSKAKSTTSKKKSP